MATVARVGRLSPPSPAPGRDTGSSGPPTGTGRPMIGACSDAWVRSVATSRRTACAAGRMRASRAPTGRIVGVVSRSPLAVLTGWNSGVDPAGVDTGWGCAPVPAWHARQEPSKAGSVAPQFWQPPSAAPGRTSFLAGRRGGGTGADATASERRPPQSAQKAAPGTNFARQLGQFTKGSATAGPHSS
jgi:hypothetical protein